MEQWWPVKLKNYSSVNLVLGILAAVTGAIFLDEDN